MFYKNTAVGKLGFQIVQPGVSTDQLRYCRLAAFDVVGTLVEGESATAEMVSALHDLLRAMADKKGALVFFSGSPIEDLRRKILDPLRSLAKLKIATRPEPKKVARAAIITKFN